MTPQGLLLLLLLLLGGGSTDSPETAHGPAAAAESDGAFQRCKRLEPDPSKWNGGMQDCTTCNPEYHIWQPCQLTARPKGSVTLLCTFNYTWEATETAQVHWRLGSFYGKFIFNHTDSTHWYTDPDYEGRVSLVGDLSKALDASIRIENLRETDSNLYFCTVSVQTRLHGVKYWRNIEGTNLTVTGPPIPETYRFNLVGMVTGAAVATAVVLGLLVFVAWRKGCCPKCPQRRRASPHSKEKPEGGEYEEFPIEGPKAPPPASPQPPARAPPPPLAPKDSGGLLYAELNLAGGRGKKKPSQTPEGGRGEESTYAILRH